MLTSVYIVVAEWGEYEQRTEQVRGVFTSLEKAVEAIRLGVEDEKPQNKLYYAWDARRKAHLARLEPVGVRKQNQYLPELKFYKESDYKEAERVAGDKPDIAIVGETIYIYRAEIDRWEWGGLELVREATPADFVRTDTAQQPEPSTGIR